MRAMQKLFIFKDLRDSGRREAVLDKTHLGAVAATEHRLYFVNSALHF